MTFQLILVLLQLCISCLCTNQNHSCNALYVRMTVILYWTSAEMKYTFKLCKSLNRSLFLFFFFLTQSKLNIAYYVPWSSVNVLKFMHLLFLLSVDLYLLKILKIEKIVNVAGRIQITMSNENLASILKLILLLIQNPLRHVCASKALGLIVILNCRAFSAKFCCFYWFIQSI